MAQPPSTRRSTGCCNELFGRPDQKVASGVGGGHCCRVQPKTEELLYLLLWSLDQAMRPTFRNLDSTYEEWAYRNGMLRQLHELEARAFLESRPGGPGARDRVWRLTDEGLTHALGGRDPREHWDRAWDGRWRLVLFDIPEERRRERQNLRRYLRRRGFGCLQNSVWVTPHPVEQEHVALDGGEINAESLLLLDARPAARETDADIVKGAWNFAAINRGYERAMNVLAGRPRAVVRTAAEAQALRDWGNAERNAWNEALEADPLLPRGLWPAGYLGEKAWKRRCKALPAAARSVSRFRVAPE